jgi:5-oxoprolinase (ATP-hydrolysing)
MDRIIGFDMGGTSTDVTHYAGHYERTNDNQIAGARIRSPMLKIVTVAAGGGSILNFEGTRLRVGPDSAGSHPGPAAYRNGGPLTVTDCNVVLGRISADHFPKVFGPKGDQPLDVEQSHRLFDEMAAKINAATGSSKSKIQYAEEFLDIAIENMANAIKKVSIDRGYDVSKYTLCSFGGAGGQHACKVAERLRIKKIYIHPLAGVLSAYGMGLADVRAIESATVELEFGDSVRGELQAKIARLADQAIDKVAHQGVLRDEVSTASLAMVRYKGGMSSLEVNFSELSDIRVNFEERYRAQYGFALDSQPIVIESIAVEAFGALRKGTGAPSAPAAPDGQATPQSQTELHVDGVPTPVQVYRFEDIGLDAKVAGPAIVVDDLATTVIEDGWTARMDRTGGLVLTADGVPRMRGRVDTAIDPYLLELFNNRFRSIAEQMGHVLANSAHSVNIKERLDFSCALFDRHRNLIANAPHIPIHFGAMSESVEAVFRTFGNTMVPGDVFVLNSPFHGGSHLPDVTLVMPIFDRSGQKVLFYSSTRGHHADIGGTTPGSLPPDSQSIHEEGALIEPMRLVHDGRFAYDEIKRVLTGARYPVRNFDQNVIDLQAQVACCVRGSAEIRVQLDEFGEDVVVAYGDHLLDMAEKELREVADEIPEGTFTYAHDLGFAVSVAIRVNKAKRSIAVDFTGSSPQLESNFNAPASIARSATLYVFRTLIDRDIPLNSGFLRPIEFTIPEGSFLNPKYPAAVSSGNAESSVLITDALFGALGILGGSQGTMNNFTFGNGRYQYYETICGGASAGRGFDGASAVHTHMTNSRMTDPEILEMRFPVRVEEFRIRRGSGGKGRWTGGDGVKRRVRFLESLDMAIVSNRRVIPPYGARGAGAASLGVNRVIRANGEVVTLKSCDRCTMNPGDAFEALTPGGGGHSI